VREIRLVKWIGGIANDADTMHGRKHLADQFQILAASSSVAVVIPVIFPPGWAKL
jgi:hypothetical protein